MPALPFCTLPFPLPFTIPACSIYFAIFGIPKSYFVGSFGFNFGSSGQDGQRKHTRWGGCRHSQHVTWSPASISGSDISISGVVVSSDNGCCRHPSPCLYIPSQATPHLEKRREPALGMAALAHGRAGKAGGTGLRQPPSPTWHGMHMRSLPFPFPPSSSSLSSLFLQTGGGGGGGTGHVTLWVGGGGASSSLSSLSPLLYLIISACHLHRRGGGWGWGHCTAPVLHPSLSFFPYHTHLGTFFTSPLCMPCIPSCLISSLFPSYLLHLSVPILLHENFFTSLPSHTPLGQDEETIGGGGGGRHGMPEMPPTLYPPAPTWNRTLRQAPRIPSGVDWGRRGTGLPHTCLPHMLFLFLFSLSNLWADWTGFCALTGLVAGLFSILIPHCRDILLPSKKLFTHLHPPPPPSPQEGKFPSLP